MITFHAKAQNLDPFAEQENYEVLEEVSNTGSDDEMYNVPENGPIFGNNCPSDFEPEISDDELHAKICTQ